MLSSHRGRQIVTVRAPQDGGWRQVWSQPPPSALTSCWRDRPRQHGNEHS